MSEQPQQRNRPRSLRVSRRLPTGAWGDPTLATREKGRAVVESIVANILKEIEDRRQAPLPVNR